MAPPRNFLAKQGNKVAVFICIFNTNQNQEKAVSFLEIDLDFIFLSIFNVVPYDLEMYARVLLSYQVFRGSY